MLIWNKEEKFSSKKRKNLTNEVKHVQSSRLYRAEWYFHGRRENTYGLWADN